MSEISETMNHSEDYQYDYVVIGSGSSGAMAAHQLVDGDHRIAVLEEGKAYEQGDFRADMFSTIYRLFREHGMLAAHGRSMIPILQGRCVGGSTVINGAIVHRLPPSVFESWCDQGYIQGLAYRELDEVAQALERELEIRQNIHESFCGTRLKQELDALAWDYQVMARNAPGCQSSRRCLQGCPTGGKWSMDRSLLPKFVKRGGHIHPERRVRKLSYESGNWKIDCGDSEYRARRVVLAAGVIHSPAILRASGLRHRYLGRGVQLHLSAGICGIMDRPVQKIEGLPQGVEVTQFSTHRIKLATQLMPPEMVLARTPLVGSELLEYQKHPEFVSNWMASIRSEALGRVHFSKFRKPRLVFTPTERDLERVRLGLFHAAELLFSLGATRVFPGICGPEGTPLDLRFPRDAERIRQIPLDPRYYLLSAGHLFGGLNLVAEQGVIGQNFEVKDMPGVFAVDAGIFPTNIGVNPQHAIMSLAGAAIQRIHG